MQSTRSFVWLTVKYAHMGSHRLVGDTPESVVEHLRAHIAPEEIMTKPTEQTERTERTTLKARRYVGLDAHRDYVVAAAAGVDPDLLRKL